MTPEKKAPTVRMAGTAGRRSFLRTAVGGAAVVFLAACSRATAVPSDTPSPAPPSSPVPASASSAPSAQVDATPSPASSPVAQVAPSASVPSSTLVVLDSGSPLLAGLYAAVDNGYFREQGLSVDLRPVADAIDVGRVATGEAQAAFVPPSPRVFNALGGGPTLKFVATCIHTPSMSAAAGLVLRSASLNGPGYTGPSDLQQLRLAVAEKGGMAQAFIERILTPANLPVSSLTLVEMSLADQVDSLARGAIDGGWLLEPFLQTATSGGSASLAVRDGEVDAGDNPLLLAFGARFLQSNPDAAGRFTAAWLKGQRDAWHTFDRRDQPPEPLLQTLASHTSLKDPSAYRSLLDGNALVGFEPNGTLDPRTLTDWQDYFTKAGSQTGRFEVSGVMDDSPISSAVTELGRLREP